MSEDTQAQFKTEGQPAFPVTDTETEDSADSSTEKTTTDPTQSLEGDENSDGKKQGSEDPDDKKKDDEKSLDQHPRWQQREQDWKERFNEQEKRHTEAIERLRKEFSPKKDDSKEQEPSEEEPASWFGGDSQQWKEFLAWNQSLVGKARENAVKEITERQESDKKAQEEATQFFNDQVKEIEGDQSTNPDGYKIDRNKLLKTVLDNKLVDTQGRWNYKAGWSILKAQENQDSNSSINDTIEEKKKVAGATQTEKKSEPVKPNYATSDTFADPSQRPW